jgi:hypothetical protein
VHDAVTNRIDVRRTLECCPELDAVTADLAFFPAHFTFVLDVLTVRIQYNPFEAAGACIEHEYRSPGHV